MSRTSSGFGGLAALRASLPAGAPTPAPAPAPTAAPLYGGAPPLTWEEAWRIVSVGLPHVADIRHILSGEEAHAASSATNAAARAAKWREEAAACPDRADLLTEAADLLMAASAAFRSAEAEMEEAINQDTAALAAVPEMKAAWNAAARFPRTIPSKFNGPDRDNPAWLDAVRQYAVPHGWVRAAEAASRTARAAAQEARTEGARLEYKAACVYAASQGRGGQIVD